MTMMSDLSHDLVEEILSRVSIASVGAVRSTCKGWNALLKDRILCKSEPKQQFVGFMMMNFRLCSMRFNLNEDLVDPSIKEIGSFLNHVKISQVYYCEGLLLCVTYDNSRLVIWNPYLGQVRWIQLNTRTEATYAFGYDKDKNHKILRFFNGNQNYYEIYDLKFNSWKVFNVIPKWDIDYDRCSASVNGNTYFWTLERIVAEGYDSDEDEDEVDERPYLLICFDFTTERFGQFLPLPFQHHRGGIGTLSSVKEEKLAVLSQRADTSVIEIWITTKIEPNEVLWIPFLKVDIEPLVGFNFLFDDEYSSFLIDEEKKVALVIDSDESYTSAYIIGENGYLKIVNLGEVGKYDDCPSMCSSFYVPSLVQIEDIARQRKREKKSKWKTKRKEKKRTKKELTTSKGNKKAYYY